MAAELRARLTSRMEAPAGQTPTGTGGPGSLPQSAQPPETSSHLRPAPRVLATPPLPGAAEV